MCVTSMCEGLDEWRGAALTCDHAGRLDGAMGTCMGIGRHNHKAHQWVIVFQPNFIRLLYAIREERVQ